MAGGSMGTRGNTAPAATRRRRASTFACLLVLAVFGLGLALSAVSVGGVGWGSVAQAHAAAGSSENADATRPTESVAYARIALVRVLSYYVGSSANSGPVPVQTACAADGVLVGASGGINSFNYVLVPSAAVSPIVPCEGVQAAFSELYGRATGWELARVTVLLNAAYTGTETTQTGTVAYQIDLGNITTDGGPTAPRLVTLPLAIPAGSPGHDLPMLTPPQASDATATGETSALDLVAYDGQLLGRDSLQPQEITQTLYPVDLSADGLTPATGSAAPTATLPSQNATGGTVLPATAPATAAPATNLALAEQLGLGTPIVNSNGRLVGMIVPDGAGNHVVASTAQITAAIGAISIRPGPLMATWQQGIAAFYSTPADDTTASTDFTKLRQQYPDFAGVAPFVAAAQAHSTSIPSLTETPVPTTAPGTPATQGVSPSPLILGALAGGMLLVALLCGVAAVLVVRRRRQATPTTSAEEQGLDLLPREMMYGVPPAPTATPVPVSMGATDVADAATLHLRAATAPGADPIANAATAQMQIVRTAAPVSRPITRTLLTLVPRAAAVSDPGIKRAGEPNQDTILAITGTRVAAGRTQPFALLAVADGMGGHNNGRDASLLTIGMLARTVLPVITGQQPLDSAAVLALVSDAIQRAHQDLRERNIASGVDMGTTVTSALLLDDEAYVFNVGDSRTYILNPDSGLRQVTTDHSIVASLVAAGVIRAEDAYHHPRRNQIHRSLGGANETIDVDSFVAPLQAGDKILLCSDGLWEMVRDPQLDHILRATADPAQAAQLLMREAMTNGGEDNIGIVVARLVEEVPAPGKATVQVIALPPEVQVPGISQ